MFVFRNIFFAVVLFTLSSGLVTAQSIISSGNSNSTNNTKPQAAFVSVEGNFSIALPSDKSFYSGTSPITGVKIRDKSRFDWEVPQGKFMVSFANVVSSKNAKQVLEDVSNTMIDIVTNYSGGTLISKKEIVFDGNPGLEIKISLQDGATEITRYYSVKNRLYVLKANWKEEVAQLKTLDSFKLIDGKAVSAKRVEGVTLKALPQSPIVKKLKSDAEDDGLKGKVESVSKSDEDLTGTWEIDGIRTVVENFYDKNGNRVKSIDYSERGYPNEVTIYGYIDGMRVSKLENINSEDNLIISVRSSNKINSNLTAKPIDKRYDNKYAYKYDKNGRLQEVLHYQNDGQSTEKVVYSYDGNKLKESRFKTNGELYFEAISILDDKSNIVERTILPPASTDPNSKYYYKYESFDAKGNWIKRVVSGQGNTSSEQHYIEYRTITYYP